MMMTRLAFPVGSIAMTAATIVGLAWWQSAVSRGGQPVTSGTVPPTGAANDSFQGPARCISCHEAPRNFPTDFAHLKESVVWKEADKHAQAYKNFFEGRNVAGEPTQRVKKMSDLLNYDVTKSQKCLSCHANWHENDPEPGLSVRKEGVSCESCHGASPKWDLPHSKLEPKEDSWRIKSISVKEAFGMVDVRDPVKRTKQCVSCHVGNIRQGKVLTHEMYAAGHPPLPSIEVETFVDKMPPHWRYLNEKPDFLYREEYLKVNVGQGGHARADDLPRTRAVVLSSLVVLRESLELDVNRAQTSESAADFARFDCAACHHELKSPGWRQDPDYVRSPPGRLFQPQWPMALTRLGVRHASANRDAYLTSMGSLQKRLGEWRKASIARPFESPDAAAINSVNELIKLLDNLIARASKTGFDDEVSKRSLDLLFTDSQYHDFHSARQTAWAIKIITIELYAGYPHFARRPSNETNAQATLRATRDNQTVEQWRRTREAATTKVDEIFDDLELNQRLALILPAGQSYHVEQELPRTLGALGEYDPQWFRDQLQKLAQRLPPAAP